MTRSKKDVKAILDMVCIHNGKTVIAVKCSTTDDFIECSDGNCVFRKNENCTRKSARGMHVRECRDIDDDTAIYFKYLEGYGKK